MSTHLILGGTGKTGRRLARRLSEADQDVRVASRSGAVRFDWDDDATWDPALTGTAGVYIVPPALRLDWWPDIERLLDRARKQGVSRAVLLGVRGGQLDPAGSLAAAERALEASGLEWGVVRPTWFMQNFTEAFFRPGIEQDGVVVAPTGDGAEPFVDVEDIAAVAAALLTGAAERGRAYDLSGPEALTFAQAAEHFGARHVDPGEAAWVAGATESGIPEDYAQLLGRLFGLIRDGHDAGLSDGVPEALGRPATSFATWAAREAGDLRQPAGRGR